MTRRFHLLFFIALFVLAAPAVAQAACTQLGGYPFSANGCLNSNDLNLSLELSQGPLPPQNASGQGARYGKLWLDTSIAPPTLRQCNVATCSKTYNSAEWALWGFLDPTNGWQWNTTFVVHTPVVAASNAALTNAPTYNNGTAGVGATLTASSNGALTVGGFSPATNDRVLIKDQVANVQNGIYTVTQTGNGANPYILTRATDFDQPAEFVNGAFVASSQQFQSFVTTGMPVPVTVGSTPVMFVTFLTGTPASSGNPTATAGPAAINGSSTFFMRSDAAPAVQTATSVQRGLVQPDNSTITISGGTISVPLLVSPPTNSVAVTSAGGVASWSTTLPSGLVMGTPSSVTLTNGTGLPVGGITGFGAGIATFLATPSSANLASALTDETGSGAAVFANTPTFVTPILGVASATSINKVAVTAPATSATLTIANGKTFTSSNTITLTGTDGATINADNVITRVNVQQFTSSGTYTPTSGMAYAIIECVGGGGGGGGATGAVGSDVGGGGGGAGSYSRSIVTAAQIGASKSVTVGAGGTASGFGNGNPGGSSSITTLCVANGGSGGTAATSAAVGFGGPGGAAGTGTTAVAGNPGGTGFFANIATVEGASGDGGSGFFGGGAAGAVAGGGPASGNSGNGPGSGASGGSVSNSGAQATGGNGSAGIVIVTEFIH